MKESMRSPQIVATTIELVTPSKCVPKTTFMSNRSLTIHLNWKRVTSKQTKLNYVKALLQAANQRNMCFNVTFTYSYFTNCSETKHASAIMPSCYFRSTSAISSCTFNVTISIL